MRNASYFQLFVMAAIVATLFLVPLAGIAWIVSLLTGVPFVAFITIGGNIGEVAGLLLWWAILLVPAFAYAATTRTMQ